MEITSLQSRGDFLSVAKRGGHIATKGLVLQALEHSLPPSPRSKPFVRVGFTTTKKLGNAVVRNRIKRRLRAVASQVIPLHGKVFHDYVLIGRKAALDRDFTGLVKDLTYALYNVNLRPSDTQHVQDVSQ